MSVTKNIFGKDLNIKDMTVGCIDKDNEVEITILGSYEYVNKEEAKQIIEHLKEQFGL